MFINQIQHLVQQIIQILTQVTDEDYRRPLPVFHGSSIGQHTRHVIEFFVVLNEGYQKGLVNYDNRKRSRELECEKAIAIKMLSEVTQDCNKPDQPLQLALNYPHSSHAPIMLQTTYYRELAFAIEHTVHHMALMRIGFEHLQSVAIPANFGVATSTQRFQSSCAQ